MLLRGVIAHALLVPQVVDAWGVAGHSIVAWIADKMLNPEARNVLESDIGGFDDLSNVSTWCDKYDHTSVGRWSAPLHYINYPSHECAFDWDVDCEEDFCVAGALVNFSQQLYDDAHFSKNDRLFALEFVIHMMGDIHQPLHVGSKLDHGGNLIHVEYDFDGNGSIRKGSHQENLHEVWDTEIISAVIEKDGFENWQALANDLLDQIQHGSWKKEYPDWQATVAAHRDESKLRKGLKSLGDETASLGCKKAYKDEHGNTIQQHDKLDVKYFNFAKPVVLLQLAKAGVRLAQLLEDALVKPVLVTGEVRAAPPRFAELEPKLLDKVPEIADLKPELEPELLVTDDVPAVPPKFADLDKDLENNEGRQILM